MNILEEFWYGNIEPAKYDASSGKEYKELLQLISRNEDTHNCGLLRFDFDEIFKYSLLIQQNSLELAKYF